jgi:hypothetical protein
MIRLDAIPISSLPQRSKADGEGPHTARVNCVLHSGPLSAMQELTVTLNGIALAGVAEGDQFVYSWQLVLASDEVKVVLLSGGRPQKYWRGCWNARNGIVHAGTLPVQVFFNGRAQPHAEAMLIPLSDILTAISAGEDPAEPWERRGRRGDEPFEKQAMTASEQLSDLKGGAVIAEGEQKEHEDGGAYVQENEVEWEDADDPEEDQEPDEGLEASDDERSVSQEHGEMTPSGALVASAPNEQQQQSDRAKQLIAFHAGPSDSVLQDLKDLVASLPTRTLIVDVRPKGRKNQAQNGKVLLQKVFGAKYWDRSWAIAFRDQSVPLDARQKNGGFRQVIEEPEHNPDGILALLQKLEQGYTLIVIDAIAEEAQSRRKAVIDELQQRIPGGVS